MIYITQFIYLKEGKEDIFIQFEDFVLPLMKQYNGKMIYRLRPDEHAYVSGEEEKPYEIHFVEFDSEEDLNNYMKDERRLQYTHLKDASVQSMLLIKGARM
ncbi:MAG: DUF1330 domain-containing protein [Bacteroidia bacterium]